MSNEQKIKVLELYEKKRTQKSIAEELGIPKKEISQFVKQFRENPTQITLEITKSQNKPAPPKQDEEIVLPTIMELLTEEVEQSGKKGNVYIMNQGVATLPTKRSTNSSKYESAIFRPKG